MYKCVCVLVRHVYVFAKSLRTACRFIQIPKDTSERVEEIRLVYGFFPCSLAAYPVAAGAQEVRLISASSVSVLSSLLTLHGILNCSKVTHVYFYQLRWLLC